MLSRKPSRNAVPPAGPHRADRLRNRRGVIGRAGDRADVRVERRRQSPGRAAKRAGETFGGKPHEIHATRHALAVIHQQHQVPSERLARDEIDLLRDVVLADRERLGSSARAKRPTLLYTPVSSRMLVTSVLS